MDTIYKIRRKESSSQGLDAISLKLNYKQNLYANLQYPFSTNYAFLDSAATDNYGNAQILLNNKIKISKVAPIHLVSRSIITHTYKGILPNLLEINTKYKTY